ncbi:hypothetical protein O0I10_008837 [Lichtheimia ornata]|uniref:Uncharacterized protein n=1 Tax=Lichtheimia ornata TaxID=688661 RepID=A0AAD7XWN0_9FUNG|nr:uncharacterized protein O0I10_008837 [Lichtheimia ornata]KAJ8655551.1 hypothetical protein O0I10_008837 [Lichtheimia ornata]
MGFTERSHSLEPWDDPVLFSLHFQHKWLQVREQVLRKAWAKRVGGIKHCFLVMEQALRKAWTGRVGGINHYFWVMELQARCSPHIRMNLWTGKADEQLARANLITAKLPEQGDPMRSLVNQHQVHRCSSYCSAPGVGAGLAILSRPLRVRLHSMARIGSILGMHSISCESL